MEWGEFGNQPGWGRGWLSLERQDSHLSFQVSVALPLGSLSALDCSTSWDAGIQRMGGACIREGLDPQGQCDPQGPRQRPQLLPNCDPKSLHHTHPLGVCFSV